jgi:gluconolactonase
MRFMALQPTEIQSKLIVDIRDTRLRDVIDVAAGLTQVVSGFEFVEGPVWLADDATLLFSDIVVSKLYRWSAAEGLSVLRAESHMANGNTLDRQGRLITCEHATSRVSRTAWRSGKADVYTILASHYDRRALNSPNDVVVSRGDAVYFTDPTFGRRPHVGVPRPPELPFTGVYQLNVDTGALTLLIDDFDQPNGLCFARDEAQLFVSDTVRLHIRVFDVTTDGTLENGRVWAETTGAGAGRPDGMKLDCEANLFCCAQGGVHIFDKHGVCLGVVRMPEHSANLVFGDDMRSLYVTASTSIYRMRTNVPGFLTY